MHPQYSLARPLRSAPPWSRARHHLRSTAHAGARRDHREHRPAARAAGAGLSGNGLEWVVNAYALTFGGLLLLGGRTGDILGRRRMIIAGIALFSTASLLGGLATAEWWLLAARAIQGTDATLLALLITLIAIRVRRTDLSAASQLSVP